LTKNLFIVLVVLLTACAGAPVQEMSDARLAIRSAQAAGADYRSPMRLLEAEQLLRQAQSELEAGNFSEAKHLALSAREEAILAREMAEFLSSPDATSLNP
jgi:hypothetical protein